MARSNSMRLLLSLALILTLVVCGECFAAGHEGPTAGSAPIVIYNNTYVHNEPNIDEDPIDVEPIDVEPIDEDPIGEDPIDEDPIDEAQPAPTPQDGDSEWTSLGTFDLAPAPHALPSRVMQLSVSKRGVVRGVYIDQTTGATQNLKGSLDRHQELLTWHVDGNPGVQYETTLRDLTSGHGKVLVMKASGAYEWIVTRRN